MLSPAPPIVLAMCAKGVLQNTLAPAAPLVKRYLRKTIVPRDGSSGGFIERNRLNAQVNHLLLGHLRFVRRIEVNRRESKWVYLQHRLAVNKLSAKSVARI